MPYVHKVMNNGYGVTQNFSVGANSLGHLLTGTQDNGSLIIDGQGNTPRNAREVKDGDGGHVAISDIKPTAAFATSYYGRLERNVDANYDDWNEFYSTNILDLHWAIGDNAGEGAFVNQLLIGKPITMN